MQRNSTITQKNISDTLEIKNSKPSRPKPKWKTMDQRRAEARRMFNEQHLKEKAKQL